VIRPARWATRIDIDTPIARLRDIGADGTVDQTLYYVTDAQHNVTAMVAENGQVVERYAYDPYGRAIVLNGEGDPDGAEYTPDADGLSDVANVILFAGYRFDAATGLYQVRHRYHHPTLGRWINRDPKGYVDGMSLYEYVASRPMGATDPMGLGSFETMAKGLMAMVNPMYASMEYNKWIARSVLGDSEVEQTVKTALGAGASITSGEVVARPLAKGLKDEPVETVASLYVVVNPLHSTYSFVVDVAETHGQYSKMTAGSGASATDQAVGTGVLVLSRKTGVLSFAESFVWRESFSGEALSQDELDYRAATAAVKLGGTAYVATQGLKVAGQGLTRMGSRLKVRLAPKSTGGFRSMMEPAEAARYDAYWQGLTKRAPIQAQPYEIIPRYTSNGMIESYTTYDKLGYRAYQYEFAPGVRHGPGYHVFDQTPPLGGLGKGPRGPHIPFDGQN
jgi:RHS repeat-associated protein